MRAVPYSPSAAAEYAEATARHNVLQADYAAAEYAAHVAESEWNDCICTVEVLAHQQELEIGQVGARIADAAAEYVQCSVRLNALRRNMQTLGTKIHHLHAAAQTTHIFHLPTDVLTMILRFKDRQLCRRARQIMQARCRCMPVQLKLQNTAGITNFQRLHPDMLVYIGNYTSKVQRSYRRVSFGKLPNPVLAGNKKYNAPILPNDVHDLVVDDAEDLQYLINTFPMPNLQYLEIRHGGSCQKAIITAALAMSRLTYNFIMRSQIVLLYEPTIVPSRYGVADAACYSAGAVAPVPAAYLQLCIAELGAVPEYLQKS